jgi:hypothetical protein
VAFEESKLSTKAHKEDTNVRSESVLQQGMNADGNGFLNPCSHRDAFNTIMPDSSSLVPLEPSIAV